MSDGIPFAPWKPMRWLVLFGSALFLLAGCTADDGTVTDDSAEINHARGSLEREIDPPIAVPKSERIGASIADVLENAKGTATGKKAPAVDGCVTTTFKDAETKKPIVEHVACKASETVRLLAEDGTVAEEHADLNGDGKVDRFSSDDGVTAQLVDTNFDGKINVVVERVDKVKDFSLEGYDEDYPKSKFLYRIREDRNRDGKLDFERLTARGTLSADE